MRDIVLVSHGALADGVKAALEMITGQQEHVHTVSLKPDGDNSQFEADLKVQIESLDGTALIIADLLGGTPCNVALKNYAKDESVAIIAGLSLPLVLEALFNEDATPEELVASTQKVTIDAKKQLQKTTIKTAAAADLEKYAAYKGKAVLVNTRIDERLIHGQVAGIWSTSLNTQRIIVANDEAAADSLQKSSLRMAASASMKLSVLPVAAAAKNIMAGKYGKQRVFLLFKNPTDVLRYLEAGGQLTTVNVGNMSHKEGTREVTKSIKVLPEEERVFEKIAAKGVKITAQLVPNDPSIDFMERLKK